MKKVMPKSRTDAAPKVRKLTLKKDTLKDLTARSKAKEVKGGAYTGWCQGSHK